MSGVLDVLDQAANMRRAESRQEPRSTWLVPPKTEPLQGLNSDRSIVGVIKHLVQFAHGRPQLPIATEFVEEGRQFFFG